MDVLFTHLKIEAHPSEPTLQDWVGTHEAYPVTEVLVSDPTVDASVREQARIPNIRSIGIEPFGFLIVTRFHHHTFLVENYR